MCFLGSSPSCNTGQTKSPPPLYSEHTNISTMERSNDGPERDLELGMLLDGAPATAATAAFAAADVFGQRTDPLGRLLRFASFLVVFLANKNCKFFPWRRPYFFCDLGRMIRAILRVLAAIIVALSIAFLFIARTKRDNTVDFKAN
ncbi:hypothetical protein B0H67DRAFT_555671 [Lasiosphaeris hirsuta]|uniref:Uncharacterized protein n=1 Tax=Lasiosphaeris hirsuta TaxID=260670 RepID=A0AA40A9R9_9PEZI|nr:hypothetical protein B0H67DRAFT_555671 [Lasiosphaeris hirsuta]